MKLRGKNTDIFCEARITLEPKPKKLHENFRSISFIIIDAKIL